MKTNLYYKQMKKLGLNTKQYAKLINMPYDVVLELLEGKENYKMSVTDILRKSLFDKHQEIENDIDNAKMKALEIKTKEIDYLKWYKEEYTPELLKNVTKLSSIKKFEDTYYIEVKGEKASHWFYMCICNKSKYKVNPDVVLEFVEQLYDIIVNGNKKQYLTQQLKNNSQSELIEWYKNFNFRLFRIKHHLSMEQIAKDLGVAVTTMYNTSPKNCRSLPLIKKIYAYVIQKENEPEKKELEIKENNQENIQNDLMTDYFENIEEQPICTQDNNSEIKIINDNDEVLRKILINRLTEEEKELIRIFGGNLK